MSRLTIALAYKDNPEMLREQQRVISTWPEPVRKLTRLIVVDDASQKHPAHEAAFDESETQDMGYTLEIYRILGADVPWGQLRARNLGMFMAPRGSWVLATDIDHVLPAECAERLLELMPEDGCYYTFARRMPNGEPTNPHPNSYLMQREWFWDEVGGCNEDFVGWYGTDSIFRARAAMFGKAVALPMWLVVYNRDGVDIGGIPGAATNLPRKNSRYHARSNEGMKYKLKRAHLDRPDNRLRFKWERTR